MAKFLRYSGLKLVCYIPCAGGATYSWQRSSVGTGRYERMRTRSSSLSFESRSVVVARRAFAHCSLYSPSSLVRFMSSLGLLDEVVAIGTLRFRNGEDSSAKNSRDYALVATRSPPRTSRQPTSTTPANTRTPLSPIFMNCSGID